MSSLAVPDLQAAPARWRLAIPLALPALLLLALLVAVAPAFFFGTGSDDAHYLAAAKCVARNGYCVPVDHWSARAMLVLPIGALFRLLGENPLVGGLVPAAYAVAATILVAWNVERLFGRSAPAIAALLLVAMGEVSARAVYPSVDLAVLAWLLAALLAFQTVMADPARRGVAVALGIFVGVAMLSRATAAAILPVVGLLALAIRPRAVPALIPLPPRNWRCRWRRRRWSIC